MNDIDPCWPEDRLAKLRSLQPQSHLLAERVQTEIHFALARFGKLSQVAKLKFMVDPENLEQKRAYLKEWDPDSKFLVTRCLLTKTKKKQGDIEEFMKAMEIFTSRICPAIPRTDASHTEGHSNHEFMYATIIHVSNTNLVACV